MSRAGLTAALTAALVLLAGCDPAARPVRIGVAGPFGDDVGAPMRRAAELAVEQINADGGIGGRPIELVALDDGGDPDSAVAVAATLARSGISAVVGHVYSGTTLAAAAVYGAGSDPVPVVTPSSSAPEIREAGDHVFRLCPTDLEHGAALANWVRRGLGFERGAVLYLNDTYGRGVRQAFTRRFVALGGQLTTVAPYLGDTPDVAAYLDRIAAAADAQFIVVAGNLSEAEEVLQQARRRGVNVPVLGGDGLEGIERLGAIAEGVYLSAAYLPTVESEANRRFVEAYRARWPRAGDPNQPAAATYDALFLLRQVMNAEGTSRRGILRGLAAVGRGGDAYPGVTGRIVFNERGDLAASPVLIGVVRGGVVQTAVAP